MAVIYSKLGGCLGETTKSGPLASTHLCAGAKGLLDKLITHLGLGSSKGKNPGECYVYWEGKALLPGKHWPGKMPPGEHHCPVDRQHCPP